MTERGKSASEELQAGERLGDFEIVRSVGRGGMGSVYLAEDVRLRRKVALKVILPELAGQADFRRRFEAEARAAAAIEHPNLVPVYAAGLADGHLYLAMRYVEGPNLNQALENRAPLGASDATRILDRVADALDAAHSAGLVHRDVTPANILLEGELGAEGVYLTDFGLVRGLDSNETQLTRTDQVIANLDYAAPEQIQGGRIDARTDVYGLGCVLYRMRSGSRPFPGTDTQKMWKIVHDPLPAIGLPGDPVDAVIARATAKDPARRFPSAGDLARAAADPDAATRVMERSVATGPAAAGYFEAEQAVRAPGWTGQSTRPLDRAQPGAGVEVGGRRRRGRLVTLAIGAAALLAGAAVATALIGGTQGGGSRTVVRETVTAPPVSEQAQTSGRAETSGSAVEREAPSETSSSGPQSVRASTMPGLESYGGIAYAGLAPSGWEHELVDKRVTDYYENLWRETGDPENTFIRTDGGNPESAESPLAASEGLVEEVRQDPEYREISYGPDHKGGREAARWVYELDGDKRADYFFVECGRGLASVGSTTPSRFPELAAMFREVAFSTEISCGG